PKLDSGVNLRGRVDMLRITVQPEPDRIRLKLEGDLSGIWVTEVEESWLATYSIRGDRPLYLDLTDVMHVDRAGRYLLGLTGCGEKSGASATPPPAAVRVEPVIEKDVPISAEWVGTLVGYVDAQIRARVAGHLVSQAYQEGSLVKTGDLLFQVDPRPFQAALE